VGTAMEALALAWRGFRLGGTRGTSFLADYGGDVNTFLECVPTYLHVVPALQVLSW
jgi:hypothetical protein